VFDSLEGRDEFEGNESLLVALDVLQQELVLGDVGIGKVELNLSWREVNVNTIQGTVNLTTYYLKVYYSLHLNL
jgi:hypothetical protein